MMITAEDTFGIWTFIVLMSFRKKQLYPYDWGSDIITTIFICLQQQHFFLNCRLIKSLQGDKNQQ